MTQHEKIMEHLKEWMKTQQVFKKRIEIASHLSMSPSHLNNILAGRRQPSKKVLEKIADMTEFTISKVNHQSISNDRPHMEFTEAMRTWFSKQSMLKSQKELSDYIGVPHSTVRTYFQGRGFPRGEIRDKLYELTEIEMLKPQGTKKKPKVKKQGVETNIDEIVQAVKIIEQELGELRQSINKKDIQTTKSHQPTHIRFADAFYSLADEILTFRDSGVIDRQKLRTMISPKDVGYVSAFLKALFDEDKFTDFILFSKYEFDKKGKSHDRES